MYAHTFKISILPKIDKKSRYKVLQKQTKINKDFIEEPFEKKTINPRRAGKNSTCIRLLYIHKSCYRKYYPKPDLHTLFQMLYITVTNSSLTLCRSVRLQIRRTCIYSCFLPYRVSHNHCPIRCCNSNELIRQELQDTLQLCLHPVHLTGYFHDNKRGRRKGWQI